MTAAWLLFSVQLLRDHVLGLGQAVGVQEDGGVGSGADMRCGDDHRRALEVPTNHVGRLVPRAIRWRT